MSLITSGMFLNGALSSGHFSSPTDLAPNLAGTIFGMSNTLSGGLTAYLTAVTVGAITQDNYTFQVRVEPSYWSRSVEILCSDWLKSYAIKTQLKGGISCLSQFVFMD